MVESPLHYLRTFGSLLLDEGSPASGSLASQKKRLALLAVLAASGRHGISRDKLLALLWPESDVDRARNALSQTLFGLRRALGEDAITGNGELRVDPAIVAADLIDFENALAAGDLERAVSHYHGPFLDGFHLRGSADFERWRDDRRARYQNQYQDALERLASTAAAAGNYVGAAEWWRRRALLDPLSARVAEEYVRQLVASGDSGAAIRYAATYESLVRAELDAEPDPAVMTAAQASRPSRDAASVAPSLHETPDVTPGSEEATRVDAAGATPGPAMRRRSSRTRLAMGLIAALIVAGVSISVGLRDSSSDLVVVLPFENETGDSTFAGFGLMAADWINQGLAQSGMAEVIDFRLALRRAKPGDAPTTIGQAVDATIAVAGMLYLRGDSVRVSARLVRVRDGSILHQLGVLSASRSEPGQVLDSLRQQVLGAVATVVDERFRSAVPRYAAPPRYDAYQEFVAGLQRLVAGPGAEGAGAHPHFVRASQLDPSFVQAKLMAYETFDGRISRTFVDSLLAEAIRQRSRLSPYDQASLDHTIALKSSDFERGYEAASRMVAVAPRNQNALLVLGFAAITTNRYREAIDVLHRIDISRGWLSELQMYWKWEMMAHHQAGDFAGALEEWRRARQSYPNDYEVCLSGVPQIAAAGDLDGAMLLLGECNRMTAARPDSVLSLLGITRELRGHKHPAEAARAAEMGLKVARGHPDRPRAPSWFYFEMGRWSDALPILLEHARDTMSLQSKGMIGVAAAGMSDTAKMRESREWLAARRAHPHYGNEVAQADLWQARILANAGARDSAIGLVRAAIGSGLAPAFFMHADKGLEPLESDGRYAALVAARFRQ